MSESNERPARFAIVISELIIVIGIISAMWAFLLPAVNAARESHGQPVDLPSLHAFYKSHPWLFIIFAPVVTSGLTAIVLGTIRQLLPISARRFIVWRSPPSPHVPPPEPINDWRPAVVTLFASLTATGLTIFAASHLHADRRSRRPVITWEGPLSSYAQYLAVAAWLLSAVTFMLGIYGIYRYRSRLTPLAICGTILSAVSCFASCLFYGAAFED